MPSHRNKKEVPRRCQCQPTCGKILSKRSRQRHYRKIRNKDIILPSQTVSDSSSIASRDEHGFLALDDIGMIRAAASDIVSERAMSIDSSHSIDDNVNMTTSPSIPCQDDYPEERIEFGSNFDDDESQSSQNGIGGVGLVDFEDVEYREEEEIEGILTVEELEQQLRDAMGAELERELYDACE